MRARQSPRTPGVTTPRAEDERSGADDTTEDVAFADENESLNPGTEPPTTGAPTTDAPTTDAPATEPPVVTAPPATDAPVTAPPATAPPATDAPATVPPVSCLPDNESDLQAISIAMSGGAGFDQGIESCADVASWCVTGATEAPPGEWAYVADYVKTDLCATTCNC